MRRGVPTTVPNGRPACVARVRYVHKHRHWKLFWRDRNQRWHHYDFAQPTADVTVLLDEIDQDPTCIFWG